MTNVTLRKRQRQGGKSYYFLEFYPPLFNRRTRTTHKQISLGIFVYDSPATSEEKAHNAIAEKEAKAVHSKRMLEVMNLDFGFLDESVFEGSFLDYYERLAKTKQDKSYASYLHFRNFVKGSCRFKDLTVDLCNKFKEYLLKDAVKKDGKHLHNNSAAGYWSLFRTALNEAYKDHYLKDNLNDYLTKIPEKKTRREFLTMPEVLALCNTPCRYDVLKRAALFSILTGLRISDIRSLQWEDIKVAPDGGPCIVKTIDKVDRDEIIYISAEALSYCGRPYKRGPVFYGLTRDMTISPLKKWIQDAGITKNITFHCFRHTFATLQIAMGTDIYTVSHQLSHRFVSTTQIYAELVDEKRRASANAISLIPDHNSIDEQ